MRADVPDAAIWSAVLCQNATTRLDDGQAACEPWRAMYLALALLGVLRAALTTRVDLTLENLALRQQLAMFRGHSKRPQFGASVVSSGYGSPTIGLGGERRFISFVPKP